MNVTTLDTTLTEPGDFMKLLAEPLDLGEYPTDNEGWLQNNLSLTNVSDLLEPDHVSTSGTLLSHGALDTTSTVIDGLQPRNLRPLLPRPTSSNVLNVEYTVATNPKRCKQVSKAIKSKHPGCGSFKLNDPESVSKGVVGEDARISKKTTHDSRACFVCRYSKRKVC